MATTQEIKGVKIIKDINNYAVGLAKFAVEEHNRKENAHLKFNKLVKWTVDPVVEGVVYYITLEASNLGVDQLWQAKVWVKESAGYIELQEFKHVVGLKDVANVKDDPDSFPVYLAKYAVEEYNNNEKANLAFVKLVKARNEPVLFDSQLYYITLEARNFELISTYEALIWVRGNINSLPWLELIDFKLALIGQSNSSA